MTTNKLFKSVLLLLFALLLAPVANAQVLQTDLEEREGMWYEKGSDTPYSGQVTEPDRMEGQIEDGKRIGEWVWYAPEGHREYMMVYENGERVRAMGWHPNGQKESEMTYKNDQRDGPMRQWDDNGLLRQEQAFQAGEPNGTNTLWDHTGALLYTAEYKEGALHGPVIWWYGEDQKRWETYYDMDERTGTWSQYDPDGDLRMQSTWNQDTLVSRHNPHADH